MAAAKPSTIPPAMEARILAAINAKDCAAFEALLAERFPLDAPLPGSRNETSLAVAHRENALDIVIALLKAGADPAKGNISTFWAVYINRPDILRLLIDRGADVNVVHGYMGRPLPFAARQNKPELVRLLIDAGADLDADAPVAEAIQGHALECALLLLKAGAKAPAGRGVLAQAAHQRQPELVQALLAAGADKDEKADIREEREGRQEDRLFCSESTPLIVAARQGESRIVQMLLEAGAEIGIADPDGVTALEWAQRNGHDAVVKLIQAGAARRPPKSDPDVDLLLAAEKGDAAAIPRLLAAGADVNARDARKRSQDFTPLMLAARSGHAAAGAALLDAGAAVEARDDTEKDNSAGFGFIYNQGGMEACREAGLHIHRTALHLAADAGHAAVVRLLLERGAAVDALDRVKCTALHLAAAQGSVAAVQALLDVGADVNACDKSKDTPLHFAAEHNRAEVIRLLLAAGAKHDLKNGLKLSPLGVAAHRAAAESVEALLAAGADPARGLLAALGTHLLEGAVENGNLIRRFKIPEDRVRRTVEALLTGGADVHAIDGDRMTPLDRARQLARLTGKAGAIVTLLEAAAKSPPRKAETPKPPPPPVKPAATARPTVHGHAPKRKPPVFSKAAQKKSFLDVLEDLEKRCGTRRQPLPNVDGGFSLHVSSGRTLDINATQAEFLERGAFVFLPDTEFKQRIAVLPTDDKYDALLAMQTNGANVGLSPEDVVAWLRKLEKDQSFTITGAGFDFLAGRFTSAIARPAELAARLAEFCPDLIDQGAGDVKAVAAQLKKDRSFFLWWD